MPFYSKYVGCKIKKGVTVHIVRYVGLDCLTEMDGDQHQTIELSGFCFSKHRLEQVSTFSRQDPRCAKLTASGILRKSEGEASLGTNGGGSAGRFWASHPRRTDRSILVSGAWIACTLRAEKWKGMVLFWSASTLQTPRNSLLPD